MCEDCKRVRVCLLPAPNDRIYKTICWSSGRINAYTSTHIKHTSHFLRLCCVCSKQQQHEQTRHTMYRIAQGTQMNNVYPIRLSLSLYKRLYIRNERNSMHARCRCAAAAHWAEAVRTYINALRTHIYSSPAHSHASHAQAQQTRTTTTWACACYHMRQIPASRIKYIHTPVSSSDVYVYKRQRWVFAEWRSYNVCNRTLLSNNNRRRSRRRRQQRERRIHIQHRRCTVPYRL